ncbi:hypothetical protein HY485_02380 [Candidatus Woesearchaeota archaeon]|nr:hypothetical protein [Candidatus Woesearchaeota archaeon]
MVNVVVRGPLWFFGIDAVFELFSFIVLALIFWLSLNAFKMTKDFKYKYFGVGFGALAIAFLSKATTDLWLALSFSLKRGTPPPSEALELVGEAFLAGYLVFIFMSLSACLVLIWLTSRVREKRIMFLTALLVLVPFYLSSSYSRSFYILSFLMYGAIAVFYVQNYLSKKSFSSFGVAAAFSAIALAQGLFLFDLWMHKLYIVAHLSQLAGFIILLTTLLKVLFYDRAKKQD